MPTQTLCQIRLNQRGEPDVAYYLGNARRLRAEATRAWTVTLFGWLHARARQLLHIDVRQPSLHH